MQAIERIRTALQKHAAAKTLAEAWMLTDEIEDALSIEALYAVLDHIDALTAENERLLMQVVACDVVAMADTPTSAIEARNMHQDYKSSACESVARRVDECIALRAENERLRKDAERKPMTDEQTLAKWNDHYLEHSLNEFDYYLLGKDDAEAFHGIKGTP